MIYKVLSFGILIFLSWYLKISEGTFDPSPSHLRDSGEKDLPQERNIRGFALAAYQEPGT